ncbi:hypothetical protein [Chamaesiphon sp.]|uniref:hypothetical protein n=1 Tax=Chamaesiphon sp. TaxID=2814140 RepID=UPI0035939B52
MLTIVGGLRSGWCARHRWLTTIVITLSTILASHLTALTEQPNRSRVKPLANGIYLYGETALPNVVGKEYIVFERIGTKVRGAFYLPRSEFSCFYGQFRGPSLDVTLFDPFDRQKYNFTLTVNSNGLTASKQPKNSQPAYQPLGKISPNDLRILAACKLQLPN